MVHGLGHGGALGALVLRASISSAAADQAGWLTPRSWLFPGLSLLTATTAASVFWGLSLIGFVAAALSVWGILVPAAAWRQLVVATSIVSIIGSTVFFGRWPPFNTVAALAVNVAVSSCSSGSIGLSRQPSAAEKRYWILPPAIQSPARFTVANSVANPMDLTALNGRVANTWKAKIAS